MPQRSWLSRALARLHPSPPDASHPLAALLDASREAMLVIEASGRIAAANRAARDLLEIEPVGQDLGRFLRGAAARPPGQSRPTEAVIHTASDRRIAGELLLSPIGPHRTGEHLLRLTDVGERVARMAELERLALHDQLTGLPNRQLVRDRLDQALRHAARGGEPATVMLLDLDGFKQINDTLGHGVGDRVLQAIPARLAEPLRRSDTLGRIGGDEFCIVLGPPTNARLAARVAERVVDALSRPLMIDEMTLELGVSIGLAVFPDHGQDPPTLLERADAAMYRAKRKGQGFCVHDGVGIADGRARLCDELGRALDNGELDLRYQPKIDARTGRLAGLEALIRWPHPARGMLGPADFLPIAERTGLIRPLTLWALETALHDQRTWAEAGDDLPVSVSLAAGCLRDEEFPALVRTLMGRLAVPRDWLVLEVTEAGLMADPERAAQILAELAGMGCRLSLDDFGTGRSSLAWLQRLSLHELKIDQSFVQAMTVDRGAAVVVEGLVRLAHALRLRVVGEGVATDAMAQALVGLGCDELQGLLFGAPVGADTLKGRLAQTSWLPGLASQSGVDAS